MSHKKGKKIENTMATPTIREKLNLIQIELKAPKNQYSTFGQYYYRSCEDIIGAVKPLTAKYRTTLTETDEIVMVGDRYYVKATAKLEDWDSDQVVLIKAFARETLVKTKMDDAQITGSASSYARKYALNGLFLTDDIPDPDSTKAPKEDPKTPVNPPQKKDYKQQSKVQTSPPATKPPVRPQTPLSPKVALQKRILMLKDKMLKLDAETFEQSIKKAKEACTSYPDLIVQLGNMEKEYFMNES